MEHIQNFIHHDIYGEGNLIGSYNFGNNCYLDVDFHGRTVNFLINDIEELNHFTSENDCVNEVLDSVNYYIKNRDKINKFENQNRIIKRNMRFRTHREAITYIHNGQIIGNLHNGLINLTESYCALFVDEGNIECLGGWITVFSDRKEDIFSINRDRNKVEHLRTKTLGKNVLVFSKRGDHYVFTGIYETMNEIYKNKKVHFRLIFTELDLDMLEVNSKRDVA